MSDDTDTSAQELYEAMHDGRTRWGYKQVSLWPNELVNQLNIYGSFGWEIVDMLPHRVRDKYTGDLDLSHYIITLKRPFWKEPIDE